MQLTQFTDLGLRVVMHLAASPADSVPRTKLVAEQLHLSYAHTTKVVARLSELGIVTTRRGRGGGWRSPNSAAPPPSGGWRDSSKEMRR